MRMFRYEKVRELEIAFMRSHYSELGNALAAITDRLVQGEFPYAAEVLKTLLDLKNERNGARAGSKAHSSSTSASMTTVRPGGGLQSLLLASESGRRTHSRGNVAPPPFRTSYHAMFSPIPSGASAPTMSMASPGVASSTSAGGASGAPVWSTYSFAVENDDDDA